MAGPTSRLLHHIFQRTGIMPDEVMRKPRFARMFMLKSMEVQLEVEAEQAAQQRAARQQAAAQAQSRRRR